MKTFDELYAELYRKTTYRDEEPGTQKLVDAGVHAVGTEVVVEAAEAWMAAEFEGHDRTAEEIAQLIYHIQVLILVSKVSLEDVYRRL